VLLNFKTIVVAILRRRYAVSRTLVFIVGGEVAEIALIEQSLRFVVGGLRLRDQSRDSSLIALQV